MNKLISQYDDGDDGDLSVFQTGEHECEFRMDSSYVEFESVDALMDAFNRFMQDISTNKNKNG